MDQIFKKIKFFKLVLDQEENVKEEDKFLIEFNEFHYYTLQKIDEIGSKTDTDSSQRSSSLSETLSENDIVPPSIQENLYTANKEHELQNSIIATAGSKPLLEAYCDHEELLLAQLLRAKGLDQSWGKILIPLCARIAHTIHPEICRTTDSMDVRNFVNFKKVNVFF